MNVRIDWIDGEVQHSHVAFMSRGLAATCKNSLIHVVNRRDMRDKKSRHQKRL